MHLKHKNRKYKNLTNIFIDKIKELNIIQEQIYN